MGKRFDFYHNIFPRAVWFVCGEQNDPAKANKCAGATDPSISSIKWKTTQFESSELYYIFLTSPVPKAQLTPRQHQIPLKQSHCKGDGRGPWRRWQVPWHYFCRHGVGGTWVPVVMVAAYERGKFNWQVIAPNGAWEGLWPSWSIPIYPYEGINSSPAPFNSPAFSRRDTLWFSGLVGGGGHWKRLFVRLTFLDFLCSIHSYFVVYTRTLQGVPNGW